VTLVCGDHPVEPGTLPIGELLGTAAQDHPDPVQRVVVAAAVAVYLLLHPASHLVDGLRHR
jgi:hypothetical protein